MSVGLLGVRMASSFEQNLASGIFDLQNATSYHVSPTHTAVSNSHVHFSSCQYDSGEKVTVIS